MAVTILILLFDSHSLQLFSCFPDVSHSFFLHRYFCSVYFLIIAGPWISVLVALAFPLCPSLLDGFIYSWASTTTYIPVTPRSVFLARNLTGIYQSLLIFHCPSTNLPLPSPCFSELAISSPHSFIREPKLKALFPLSHQSQVILVIPLVTPKAVHFSPSLLFYFRPLSLSLAQMIAKASVESPLWSASCKILQIFLLPQAFAFVGTSVKPNCLWSHPVWKMLQTGLRSGGSELWPVGSQKAGRTREMTSSGKGVVPLAGSASKGENRRQEADDDGLSTASQRFRRKWTVPCHGHVDVPYQRSVTLLTNRKGLSWTKKRESHSIHSPFTSAPIELPVIASMSTYIEKGIHHVYKYRKKTEWES